MMMMSYFIAAIFIFRWHVMIELQIKHHDKLCDIINKISSSICNNLQCVCVCVIRLCICKAYVYI